MQEQLNPEEINKLVNKTIDLQNQAESALKQARTMRVFDPRNEADITSNENAVVWTTKSIELAYEALKKGFGLRKNPFLRGNIDIRKANLTFQYTEEEISEIIKCKKDIVYFANKYVYLKTSTGRKQIKLRPYQVKLLRNLQEYRWNILNFSRQCGKTTTTAIFFMWFLCFHVDKTAAIVANKESIATEVFSKVKSIYEFLPFFLKPGAYTFSSTTISFDNGCKAIYRTASIDTVQGYTIDLMFVDEFAYIKNTKSREFWVNAYPTLSSIPDSRVIIASTPNGRNLFFELWDGAINNKNLFHPMCIYYWQVPGRDEKWVAQEKANIGEEGFAQQYELSFDTKMKAIIDKQIFKFLDKISQKFEPGLLPIGYIHDEYFRWNQIFKYSLKNDWFFVSVDIGEGLGNDASTMKIKKLCKIGEDNFIIITIGVWESYNISIPEFAEAFVCLCRRLNLDQTRLIIERNTYGDLFMLHVQNIEEKSKDGFEIPLESYAKFSRKEGAKLEKGLRLNSKNKRYGVTAYKNLINAYRNIETDDKSIDQIREFGEDEKGNFKASVGHDDLVMPEVNLSYYIESDNSGYREFIREFLDESSIDDFNVTLLEKMKIFAENKTKEENDPKYQIEQISKKKQIEELKKSIIIDNEYIQTVSDKDTKLSVFGSDNSEERKKIIKDSGDEYSLIDKFRKNKPKIERRPYSKKRYGQKNYVEDLEEMV